MKTLQEMIERGSQCIDGRDFHRLAAFMSVEQIAAAGMVLKEEAKATWVTEEWTRENILTQLATDVGFGFEKALDQRGLSAGMMLQVVGMWVIALEDEGIKDYDFESNYAQYGLPGFKAVALHYGLPNPIGDNRGDEKEYAA